MPDTYRNAWPVTPSDSANLQQPCNAIYIGGAGTLKVTTLKGQQVTFSGCLAGTIIPIGTTKIFSTGTSATNIVAMFT